MKKDTTGTIVGPAGSADLLAGSTQEVLPEIFHDGAQRLLDKAEEAEVAG